MPPSLISARRRASSAFIPSAQVVFDVQLEMALHFGGKFAVSGFFAKQTGDAEEPCANTSHNGAP